MNHLDDDKLRALLNKCGKTELVEWIIAQAAGNEDFRRTFINLVAPLADVATLVSELSQIISKAWGRTRTSREPWKLARPIASDLEPVLPTLEQLIERGQAQAAEKVLRRFVEAAEKGFDHVDDSYGYLGPLCQQAVTLWGKAWARIETRDSSKLAKLVYEGVQDNNYAVRDHMIRDFAEALGRGALLELKATFEAEYEATAMKLGLDEWKRREPLRHLANVADALSDVDLYIDVQRRGNATDIYAMPIARRLLEAGRVAEALEHLDRANANRSHFNGEPYDYTTLRCKILEALGRKGEAREALWQEFLKVMSNSALERVLAATPAEEHPAVLDKAIAEAERYRDKVTAATFLIERGETNRAAMMIDACAAQLNGCYYGTLLHLAEALQREFPESAWALYRVLLMDILEEKRTKAYHHAADYLAITDELATRTGLRDKQQELRSLLRQKHGRKYAFWSLVRD